MISNYISLTCHMFVFLCSTMTRRRQNTILVKVPVPEESQEDQESGSEASDSVSNGGQAMNTPNGQNVTLITLNSEGITAVDTKTVEYMCIKMCVSNMWLCRSSAEAPCDFGN